MGGVSSGSVVPLSETELRQLVPVVLAAEQRLPVPDVFADLLPGAGLQRGWTVHVGGGPSSRALAWAMLSTVTNTGGWIGAVDVPGIGLAAAREVGVAIERVLVVNTTESDAWSGVVSALVGAVDVVVFGSPRHRVSPSEQRRLSSRARERGSVIVELDGPSRRRQQFEYDVRIEAELRGWRGLGDGHGCLQARELDIIASGRRIAGPPRRVRLAVPDVDGTLRRLDQVEEGATVPHLRVV